MTSIETKYIGATNTRGARIQVKAANGITKYYTYPVELSGDDVHDHCAELFLTEYKWTGRWASGRTKHNGLAYVKLMQGMVNVIEVV
jgi:hypothetical protein